MNLSRNLFWLLLFFLPTSCISYRYIDLQVLNPGSARLPGEINLHILQSQKPDSNCDVDLKDSTLNPVNFCKSFISNFDSTFVKQFKESPKCSDAKVIIQSESDFQKENSSRSLNEKNKQLLMRLDRIELREGNKILEFDDQNFCFVASYGFIYKLKIEIRNAGNDRIYDTTILSDTLVWSNSNFFKDEAYNGLPNASLAVMKIGQITGEQYAKIIAPYWTTEERMLFYSSNKCLRKGYNQFVADDLDGAVQTWKHLYEVGTPYLASIAAHNIGLVYEMLDDFDNSELWLNNSLKTQYHRQTESYLERVKERKANRKDLDEQIQSGK